MPSAQFMVGVFGVFGVFGFGCACGCRGGDFWRETTDRRNTVEAKIENLAGRNLCGSRERNFGGKMTQRTSSTQNHLMRAHHEDDDDAFIVT